jgi:hypothetical protein
MAKTERRLVQVLPWQHNIFQFSIFLIFFFTKRQISWKIKTFPRDDGAKRRARVLIPPGYLHPGKRKH